MNYQRYYGNIIWTNHAIDRLRDRGLSQETAWQAFRYPDEELKGRKNGTFEFRKNIHRSNVTIIAKQNEKNEWLVLSAWIDPPVPGSTAARQKEEYKKYRKMGFWGKVFFSFKKQLGF